MFFSKDEQGAWPAFVDVLAAVLSVMFFVLMMVFLMYWGVSSSAQRSRTQLTAVTQQAKTWQQQAYNQKQQADLTRQELAALQELAKQLQASISEKEHAIAQLRQGSGQKDQDIAAARQQQASLQAMIARLQQLLAQKEALEAPSVFFAKMRKALQGRSDVRVVGDRFVFPAEVLFPLGSARVTPQGEQVLAGVAMALKGVLQTLPADVPWVLRVDGHTDKHPVKPGGKFTSNLELSAARALSVVQILLNSGLPQNRFAVAGFGEFRAQEQGNSSARDRRIELMIDQGYGRDPVAMMPPHQNTQQVLPLAKISLPVDPTGTAVRAILVQD